MSGFILDQEEEFFNWGKHGHLVAIGAQQAIAVYSVKGSDRIVLRQEDTAGERDDVIVVNADQVPNLIKALQDVLHARVA
jgi:hypothetical protein